MFAPGDSPAGSRPPGAESDGAIKESRMGQDFGDGFVDAPAALLFVFGGGGEDGVGFCPLGFGEAWRPERLRFGAVHDDRAEAFELASPAAVEERIISEPVRFDQVDRRRVRGGGGGFGVHRPRPSTFGRAWAGGWILPALSDTPPASPPDRA